MCLWGGKYQELEHNKRNFFLYKFLVDLVFDQWEKTDFLDGFTEQPLHFLVLLEFCIFYEWTAFPVIVRTSFFKKMYFVFKVNQT